MGVFSDIKDSVTASEEDNSIGGRRKNKGLGDTDLGDSSISQSSSLGSQLGDNNSSNQLSGSQQSRTQGQSRQRKQQRQANRTPNSHAGRPQPGSDQPQVSQNTQRKMENAGIKPTQSQGRENQRYNQTSGGRDSGQSVSNSRDEFEELKAQNEQIIELLKRINSSLQRLG